MFRYPENYRIRKGEFASASGEDGAFHIPVRRRDRRHLKCVLSVIASQGGNWEHVSVSLRHRCPTWEEMCYIRGLFWEPEDCVMQLHPPRSSYINNHKYCLHMWRPTEAEIPRPPEWMVGIPS